MLTFVAAIWLITGAQASGKTTVADLLARSFARGVHVRGGQFHRWAVTGWVHFDDQNRPEEARRLLELRYRLSAHAAATYADAGFTCVVQDNIYGADVAGWIATASTATASIDTGEPRVVHLVVLRPSVEVLTARDQARRRATGKVAYRDGFTPSVNDAHLATTPPYGLWVDTSRQTAEETVAEILARESESRV